MGEIVTTVRNVDEIAALLSVLSERSSKKLFAMMEYMRDRGLTLSYTEKWNVIAEKLVDEDVDVDSFILAIEKFIEMETT